MVWLAYEVNLTITFINFLLTCWIYLQCYLTDSNKITCKYMYTYREILFHILSVIRYNLLVQTEISTRILVVIDVTIRHFFGLSAKLIKRPSHSYDKWPLGRGISMHFRELWYLSFVRDEIMIFLWQITTSSVILIIKSTRFVWIRTVLILLS